MKTLIFYSAILFAFSMLFLSSCDGQSGAGSPNGITYDTISVAEMYHLDNDSTKPSCSLKINYVCPVDYADAAVLKKIQSELNLIILEDETLEFATPEEAVKAYIEAYIENYKAEAADKFSDLEEIGGTGDYFSFYKKIDAQVVFDKAGILCYQVASKDDRGVANSSTHYINTVFDLSSGKVLTEDDLFAIGYRDKLDEILIAHILKQKKAKSTDEIFDLGYVGIDDLSSNNNFVVNEKGISYIFNSGEYTTPLIGEIRIDLPYNEVKFLLKENSPIAHFYN